MKYYLSSIIYFLLFFCSPANLFRRTFGSGDLISGKLLYLTQNIEMEQLNARDRKDVMYFLISLVVCLALLMISPEFFWVALPFTLTYLVKSLNMM